MTFSALNQTSPVSWLQLFQLMSPNLPVGGFTYSQGLEWAVETGWVKNAAEFEQWLIDQMDEGLVYLDWPLLNRLYVAVVAGGTAGHIWGTDGTNGVLRLNNSLSWTKDAGNAYVTLAVETVDGGTF